MEKIKVVSEDTTTNKAAPKEKDFHLNYSYHTKS